MRGTAICWIALAAGCAFEGGDGSPLIGDGPELPKLPVGDGRVTGIISSPHSSGSFIAALMPAGAQLPANNPCPPKGTRTVEAMSDRTFVFDAVAPDEYILVGFRTSDGLDEIERTMTPITVAGLDTDGGTLTLPQSIVSERDDGGPLPLPLPGDGDKVTWSAPTAGFSGFAYRIGGRGADACTTGTSLPVFGTYGVNLSERDKTRIGLESLTGQMAIKVIDSGGRRN